MKDKRKLMLTILFVTISLSLPYVVYRIIEDSFDVRNEAEELTGSELTSFEFNTYRGMARFGAGAGVDIFSTEELLPDWEEFQFGWYHNWRIWEGHSHLMVEGLPTQDAPPLVGFSGIISPGWSWAEPIYAGCTDDVKGDLETYEDGDIIWVGNEPGWGDNRDPTSYAKSYKGWYDCIKSVNPNIKVSPGAFTPSNKYGDRMSTWENPVDTMQTPSRWDGSDPNNLQPPGGIGYLNYLDYAKEDYEMIYGVEMPIDAYVIHLYNHFDDPYGNDVDTYVATLRSTLRDFRQWMRDNGEERLPLTIKEMGFLIVDPLQSYDEPEWDLLGEKMTAMIDMVRDETDPTIGNPNDNNRLVQRWNWFTAVNGDPCVVVGGGSDCGYFNSSLVHCTPLEGHIGGTDCSQDRVVTPLGESYLSYIDSIASAYDTQPPTEPIVTYSLSDTTVTVNFSSSDNTRVNDYEISLGSQGGVADAEVWRSTNTQTTYTFENAEGKYVNVKAVDDGYNWSDIGSVLVDGDCVGSCEGKECGSDGCGGICGNCTLGYCVNGTCTSSGGGLLVDIDGDGDVDMTDYYWFVEDYLFFKQGYGLKERSDLNGDQKMSMIDYSIFVDEYLKVKK